MTNARTDAVVDESSSATESSRQNTKRQVATKQWADSAKGKCILMSSLSRNNVWAVTPQAQLLLRILIDYAGKPRDEGDGNAVFIVEPRHSPTLEEIAERNPGRNRAKPTTVRTVQRWLRELKEAGLVEATKTELKNGYRITLPLRAIEGATTGARAHSVQEPDERDGCNVETEHHDDPKAFADAFIEALDAVPLSDGAGLRSVFATLNGKRLDTTNALRVKIRIEDRMRALNHDITEEQVEGLAARWMKGVTLVADRGQAVEVMTKLGVDPAGQREALREHSPDAIIEVAKYVQGRANARNPAGLFRATLRDSKGNRDWMKAKPSRSHAASGW